MAVHGHSGGSGRQESAHAAACAASFGVPRKRSKTEARSRWRRRRPHRACRHERSPASVPRRSSVPDSRVRLGWHFRSTPDRRGPRARAADPPRDTQSRSLRTLLHCQRSLWAKNVFRRVDGGRGVTTFGTVSSTGERLQVVRAGNQTKNVSERVDYRGGDEASLAVGLRLCSRAPTSSGGSGSRPNRRHASARLRHRGPPASLAAGNCGQRCPARARSRPAETRHTRDSSRQDAEMGRFHTQEAREPDRGALLDIVRRDVDFSHTSQNAVDRHHSSVPLVFTSRPWTNRETPEMLGCRALPAGRRAPESGPCSADTGHY